MTHESATSSQAWLDYFENNQRPDQEVPERLIGLLPPERAILAASVARFQLGEASGGRLFHEVMVSRDAALDPQSRAAIRLYVLEEHRHARELLAVLLALGGEPLAAHWSSSLFRRCRRLLGLRTKLVTLAVAEVVGIVFYSSVAERAADPDLKRIMGLIAREEAQHLEFVASWFRRALANTPRRARRAYAGLLEAQFLLILCAALLTVAFDHRLWLGLAGLSPARFASRCLSQARRRWPGSRAPAEGQRETRERVAAARGSSRARRESIRC